MTSLGISIVNFNSGKFLIKCLESLDEVIDKMEPEIWVIDNASSDNNLDIVKKKFPKLNYIENKENLGFSKAHNLALKKIKAGYVLVLNPDTEVHKGTVAYLIDYLEGEKNVGAVSPKIELGNGEIDWASHRGLPTPWAAFLYYFLKDDSLYHLTRRPMDKPHEVDAISGSFFLTRKSVLEKVGYFDEDYFMYAEDIDLCYRIKEAGYQVMYVPTVSIIHHKGVSSGLKVHSREIATADYETRMRSLNAFYQTMGIFYKKHLAEKYPFFVNWLVYLGINVKWALAKRKMHV